MPPASHSGRTAGARRGVPSANGKAPKGRAPGWAVACSAHPGWGRGPVGQAATGPLRSRAAEVWDRPGQTRTNLSRSGTAWRARRWPQPVARRIGGVVVAPAGRGRRLVRGGAGRRSAPTAAAPEQSPERRRGCAGPGCRGGGAGACWARARCAGEGSRMWAYSLAGAPVRAGVAGAWRRSDWVGARGVRSESGGATGLVWPCPGRRRECVGSRDCAVIVTWKRSHSKASSHGYDRARWRCWHEACCAFAASIPSRDIAGTPTLPNGRTNSQVTAGTAASHRKPPVLLRIGSFTKPKRGLQSATIIDGSAPIEICLSNIRRTRTGGGPARTPPPMHTPTQLGRRWSPPPQAMRRLPQRRPSPRHDVGRHMVQPVGAGIALPAPTVRPGVTRDDQSTG